MSWIASDISHSDYCDNSADDEDDGLCGDCRDRQAKEQAYWFSIFDREPEPMTEAEIRDVYRYNSGKRERLLRELSQTDFNEVEWVTFDSLSAAARAKNND